jgi:hypothetical protein
MPLTSRITLSVQANYTSALDLVTAQASMLKDYQTVLQTGTGAGQADKIFSDTRTLAASGTEDLDLAGVLTDAFGASITFVKIKALIISAAAGNTNNVLVGGVAAGLASILTPAATGVAVVRPGATFAVFAGQADAAGYAVTATTADLLHIVNSAGSTTVTYDVIIIGTSA